MYRLIPANKTFVCRMTPRYYDGTTGSRKRSILGRSVRYLLQRRGVASRAVLVREANPCSVRERLPFAPFSVIASPTYPCELALTLSNQRIASKPN